MTNNESTKQEVPDKMNQEQTPTAMIKVDGVSKRYGEKLAVNNISFEVKGGEVVGFLGL